MVLEDVQCIDDDRSSVDLQELLRLACAHSNAASTCENYCYIFAHYMSSVLLSGCLHA